MPIQRNMAVALCCLLLTPIWPIQNHNLPQVDFESRSFTLPVCNDGTPSVIAELVLTIEKPTKFEQLTLSDIATTDRRDIESLRLVLDQKPPVAFASLDELKASNKFQGSLTLSKGKHRFQLVVVSRKGANLLNKLDLRMDEFTIDGVAVPISEQPGSRIRQRFAYPIHHRNQFDCHTFRIPGIARANNGDLLAVYDMRYNSRRDLQEHIDIGLSVSKDGGQTWSDPKPIMDMGEFGGKSQKENGCSDPVILVDRQTGEIFVAACWTHGKPNTHQWSGNGSEPGWELDQSTQFMVVRSSDHGESWSQPDNLTKQLKQKEWYLFAPAPGNGITLADGKLVIPTQGRDENGLPFSNITWSEDHGKTWNVSPPARDNTTECAVAELSDGSLMLNMRDNRNRKLKDETNGRAISVTDDFGKTWQRHDSDHQLLPEPVCMASMISVQVKLASGKRAHRLFFSNPNNKHRRAGMTIRVSSDEGTTWPHQVLLDSRGGAYSSLVEIDDKTIGILYESSVADFVFQKIPIHELMGPKPNTR
ncbi:MAG: sialidase family protein [Planctomycetota bacterium]